MKEEFAGQHVADHDVRVLVDGTPGADQEPATPPVRADGGRRQGLPPQIRQRSRNPTRVGDGFFKISVPVDRDQIDTEKTLQSNQIGAAPGAPDLFSRDRGLALEILLDQLPELDRDLCAAAEDGLDGRGEPAVDRSLEEIGRDQEDQDHRNKGQTDIGQNQFRAKPAAEDAGFSFESETQHIAKEDEAEDDDERDVEVPQNEEQKPVRELLGRGLTGPLEEVEAAHRERHQKDESADEKTVLFVVSSPERSQAAR